MAEQDRYIDAQCLYVAKEAARRLGLGRQGFRAMKRAGLRVARFGRGDYVSGAAIIEFFRALEGEGAKEG